MAALVSGKKKSTDMERTLEKMNRSPPPHAHHEYGKLIMKQMVEKDEKKGAKAVWWRRDVFRWQRK